MVRHGTRAIRHAKLASHEASVFWGVSECLRVW